MFLAKDGNVVIALKTSCDHGTTHIMGISCSAQRHSWGAFRRWFLDHGLTRHAFMVCSPPTASRVSASFHNSG
jgi:hypothetical protein